jgi:hypothetical protein
MKTKALLSVLLLLQIVLQSVYATAVPSKPSLLPDSLSEFSASNHHLVLPVEKNVVRDSVKQVVPKSFNLAVTQYIEALTKRKEQVGKMLGLSNYYFPVYEKVFKELKIYNFLNIILNINYCFNNLYYGLNLWFNNFVFNRTSAAQYSHPILFVLME